MHGSSSRFFPDHLVLFGKNVGNTKFLRKNVGKMKISGFRLRFCTITYDISGNLNEFWFPTDDFAFPTDDSVC
jgi:hypothetical protein